MAQALQSIGGNGRIARIVQLIGKSYIKQNCLIGQSRSNITVYSNEITFLQAKKVLKIIASPLL